jgi:hypothetical protein
LRNKSIYLEGMGWGRLYKPLNNVRKKGFFFKHTKKKWQGQNDQKQTIKIIIKFTLSILANILKTPRI